VHDNPLSEHDLALYMLERMQEAVAAAWAEQTSYLESSREQILSKKGKKWYDIRDERYLLETNTVPVNLEAAMAQRRAAEQQQSVVMTAVEKIVERINPPVSQRDVAEQIQQQVEASLGNLLDQMSPEQLEAILARKRAMQDKVETPTQSTEERRKQNSQTRREQKQAEAQAQAAQQQQPEEEPQPATEEADDLIEALDDNDDEGEGE